MNYAVILAAGIGSRLYPITEKMPKSLVKVCGREILDYQIAGYLRSGIPEKNIFIVTGYMSEMMEKYIQNKYRLVNAIHSKDYLATNNMYSLYLALRKLKDARDFELDTLFINNADCLYDERLMLEFAESEYSNAIACEQGVYIEESMKVVVDSGNRITNIAKTIPPENAAGVSVDLL